MLSHIGPTADRLRRVLHDAGYAAGMLAKAGGAPESVYALSGRLIASQSGWAILEVPNALVRGIFAAMDEPGVELPPSGPNDQLNAHISVLTKDELDRIGGPDALSERGQRFRYQLGPIKKVKPSGWDMAAVYMVEIQSPALKKLRVSYGLPPLPHGDHQFHITVCVRKKGTLQAGPVSKAAATDDETQVRAVVRSIPKDDLYGAWYHPGDRKVRVSLGDWSETSGRDVHARLSAVLGTKAVEVEAEIGRPDPFDGWIKLAENTLTRGADTFDVDALIARLHGRESETLPVDAFTINRSRNTGFSPRRLAAADVSFPMIVGPGDDVLDGKHRTVKLRSSGATHGRYLRATPEDLDAVKLAWSRELSSAPAEEVTYDPNLGRPDGVREAACRGPVGRAPGCGPGGAGSIPVGMPLGWLDSAPKAAALDDATTRALIGAGIGAGVGGLGGYAVDRARGGKRPGRSALIGAGLGGVAGGLGGAVLPPPDEWSSRVSEAVESPTSRESLGTNIAHYYEHAPGGFSGAVDRAVAAQSPVDGLPPLRYTAADVAAPIAIHESAQPPLHVARQWYEGGKKLKGGTRQFPLSPGSPPQVSLYTDAIAGVRGPDPRQYTKEHELTHAALDFLPNQWTPWRRLPNAPDTRVYSDYKMAPTELVPYLAAVKRDYVAAHPGQDVSTPAAAGAAIDWQRNRLADPATRALIPESDTSVWDTWNAQPARFQDMLRRLMPQVVDAGMPARDHSKTAARDFAPGLPRRDDKGDHTKLREGELATWIVQKHDAIRSGLHKDVRVGNPELGMFSWATKKDVPTPGQTVAFHQQPVHRYSYNSFQGTIPSGRYGAGTVRRQDAGEALVTRSTPHKLELTLAHKRDQPRLDLTAIGPVTWLARNTTPTEPVPYAKVHHKSVAPDDLPKVLETLPPGSVGQPKVDGASTLVSLLKRGPELTSYRTSSTSGHPIIQTEKIFHGRPAATYSKDLIGTILKGELYGTHLPRRTDQSETPGTHRQDRGGDRTSADAADLRAHDGGAGPAILHPQQLGAILNSTLANSIRSQRRQGIDLKAMLYDIQQHGKQPIDLATTPYAERRRLLEGIVPHLPPGKFHLAPQVEGPEAIGKLYDDVVSGRNDLTREGVVIHEPTGRPLKVKQTEEHDVVATGMYPGEGRRSRTVGGLLYAHADDPEKTVGRVGGGFDDETLRQIAADPQAFIGRTMRLRAQEKYPETGALRAPRFLAWHEG
jgi:hypothetical protein